MIKAIKTKAQISLFLFFILILLIAPVSSIDEYGNELTVVNVLEFKTGSWENLASFTTNPTTTNVTTSGNFLFVISGVTLQNDTFQPDYNQVLNTSYLGFQMIAEEESYQKPMMAQSPYYATGGYWVVTWQTDYINIDIEETAYCNVTHWINYHNGSSWLLEDSWKFNLVIEDLYEPPVYSQDLSLSAFFFWGMILTAFTTPLAFVGAIKLHNGQYIGYGILSFIGFVSFLGMFTGLKII